MTPMHCRPLHLLRQLELGIELIRFGQCIGIDENQGIQARALIVGSNALQILFDDLVAADPMFADGALRFGDGGFADVEAGGGLCRSREHARRRRQNGQAELGHRLHDWQLLLRMAQYSLAYHRSG